MNNINSLIEKRREEIITEGSIGKIISSLFKGAFAIIFGPYICILAFLIIISPFILISKHKRKVEEDKVKQAIRFNPEFLKYFNKISQNIANTFIKAMNINGKNYFSILSVSYDDIFVEVRQNGNEVAAKFLKLNSEEIFKDITKCFDYNDYCDTQGHEDPDSEPDCEELEKFFKKLEYTIKTINQELQIKYKGLRIDFSEDIDYDYLFSSLGIFEREKDYPGICLYCKSLPNINDMDENIQKEIQKTITTMKPIVERRMKNK